MHCRRVTYFIRMYSPSIPTIISVGSSGGEFTPGSYRCGPLSAAENETLRKGDVGGNVHVPELVFLPQAPLISHAFAMHTPKSRIGLLAADDESKAGTNMETNGNE